ncbi:MAG: hypothetical protein ACI85I_002131 [Arenicella sp.]|jgi:hypothetical protein
MLRATTYKSRIFCFAFVLLSFNCHAQLLIGTGATYGSDISQVAPQFRLYYYASEKLCFGPEFSYFPKTTEADIERQLTEYGFAIHYIFEVGEKIGIYPLTSINYSKEREWENHHLHTTEAFGLGVGGGLHGSFGNFLPFAEVKYLTGELKQTSISIGLIYNINWREE